jgi:hypothetical protein
VPTVARFIPAITLRKRDEDVQGFYVAAAGIASGWRGAVVMHSLDAGQSWRPLATLKRETAMGRVMAVEFVGVELDALTIRLLHSGMSLESRAEEDVEAGANRILIGGEVFSFAEARLTEACTYRLTGLARGRKHTPIEELIACGQSATLIDERTLARVDVLDDRARKGVYVVASSNQRVIDEPAAEFEEYLN